jgi:hypothetical protein
MPRQPIAVLRSLFFIVTLFYLTGCHTSILAPDFEEDPGITQDPIDDGSGDDTGSDDTGGGGNAGDDTGGGGNAGDDTAGGGNAGDDTGGSDGGDDAGQAPVSLEAPLSASDGSDASGEAKYERRTDRITFSVDVENMQMDGIGRVVVERGGVAVFEGSIDLDDGSGDLNLDSREGDDVPSLRGGDRVRVEDPAGATGLSGIL